jgi:hypothetical protein
VQQTPESLVRLADTGDDARMAVVRAVLLVVVACLFVTTLSMVFVRETGLAEKLVLVAARVLLSVVVPRIQRLGRPAVR